MATLGDLAKLVRSKNAGPFWLTIDIMFDDADAYRRARDAEIVNRCHHLAHRRGYDSPRRSTTSCTPEANSAAAHGATGDGYSAYFNSWQLFQLPYAVVGISVISALYQRHTTGAGRHLQVAMQDAQLNYTRGAFVNHARTGQPQI